MARNLEEVVTEQLGRLGLMNAQLVTEIEALREENKTLTEKITALEEANVKSNADTNRSKAK